jgi:hypothetical protein
LLCGQHWNHCEVLNKLRFEINKQINNIHFLFRIIMKLKKNLFMKCWIINITHSENIWINMLGKLNQHTHWLHACQSTCPIYEATIKLSNISTATHNTWVTEMIQLQRHAVQINNWYILSHSSVMLLYVLLPINQWHICNQFSMAVNNTKDCIVRCPMFGLK